MTRLLSGGINRERTRTVLRNSTTLVSLVGEKVSRRQATRFESVVDVVEKLSDNLLVAVGLLIDSEHDVARRTSNSHATLPEQSSVVCVQERLEGVADFVASVAIGDVEASEDHSTKLARRADLLGEASSLKDGEH